jgi:Dual specificity phosphatase, catalytic domain
MSLVYQLPPVATVATNKPLRPSIYVGGKVDAKNHKQLIQRHITHILNVTPPKETCYKTGVPNYFEQKPSTVNAPPLPPPSSSSSSVANIPEAMTKFQYLRIPIYDSSISTTTLYDAIDSICTFINQAIVYQQTSILIHCQRGISRSVTVAIIYLIR